jgi:hypothetical protein
MSRRFHGLCIWNEYSPMCWRRPRNSQNKVFLTQCLIGGSIRPPFGLRYLVLQILHSINYKFLANFKRLKIEVYSYATWCWTSKAICIDSHESCLVCQRYKWLIFLVILHQGMETYSLGDYILPKVQIKRWNLTK